ncbi:unnamed protein product, partial [Mesorhabditis belari]|uniref:Uncharacterized protein n=1 Tax=Mesorhabditis belari TaxID=2138241 RepID=A0AAF3ESN5_9BILA
MSHKDATSDNKSRQQPRTSGAAETAPGKGGGRKQVDKDQQDKNGRYAQSVSQTHQSKHSEGEKRRTRTLMRTKLVKMKLLVTNQGNQRHQHIQCLKIATVMDIIAVRDVNDDLEKPFSDTDDETVRHRPEKPNLFIPRGRIRTLSGTVPVIGYSPKWGGPTMSLYCLQFFELPYQIGDFEELAE